MKSFIAALTLVVVALVSGGYAADAEAQKRFGGGKSSGMQRESTTKSALPPAKAAPAVAPASPAAAAPMSAAAPKPSGASKWLGPLAGLAAGGLLASLFMGGGFAGLKMLDIVVMIALVAAAFMLFRWFMRRQAPASGAMQYAGAAAGGSVSAPEMPQQSAPAADGRFVVPEIGSRLAGGNASVAEIESATANPRIPADFEVAPFEREARAAFIRLQAANDRKDLNDIRDFTTPEMYAEISVQLMDRGAAAQQTEVVTLAAHVLEVVTENGRAIASTRFTGTLREELAGAPLPFDEVWHVVKNVADKNSTWQLAGIQQLA